jgi:hypothetical protein
VARPSREAPTPGARRTAHGARRTAHGARRTAHGARRTAHGARRASWSESGPSPRGLCAPTAVLTPYLGFWDALQGGRGWLP